MWAPIGWLIAAPVVWLEPSVGLDAQGHQRLAVAANEALSADRSAVILWAERCRVDCAQEAAQREGEPRILQLRGIAGPTQLRVLITTWDTRTGDELSKMQVDLPLGAPDSWAARLRPGLLELRGPPAEERSLAWAPPVLIGSGVAALALGVYFGARSQADRDALPAATSSAEVTELGDRAQNQGLAATLLIGFASAALIGGAVWWAGDGS